MKTTRDLANRIFIALGCVSAPSWNNARMGTQLMKVGNLVTPDTVLDPELDPTLRSMLAAIETGEGVTLEGADAPAPAPTPGPAPTVAEVPEANGARAATDVVAADTKPPKAKRTRAKKADAATPATTVAAVVEKAAEPVAPVAPVTPAAPRGPWDIKATGVRADDTNRGFTAGLVIANFGLPAGVDKAQTELYEKINGLTESGQTRFNLANAWHMINGYLEGVRRAAAGLDPITGQPKA